MPLGLCFKRMRVGSENFFQGVYGGQRRVWSLRLSEEPEGPHPASPASSPGAVHATALSSDGTGGSVKPHSPVQMLVIVINRPRQCCASSLVLLS